MISTSGFKTEQIDLTHEALPAGSPPLVIAHVSDLHLRRWDRQHELLIETLNGRAVDFVFLTGDLVTGSPTSIECLERLVKQVRCRFGLFACRGNWDVRYGPPLRRLRLLIESCGGTLLTNESRTVATHAGRVRIIGLDDLQRGWPDMEAVPDRAAESASLTILLSHAPMAAVLLPENHGVDFVLSGHTHGGQIRIPLLWRKLLPNCHGGFSHGLYGIGALRLYVNRGFGSVGVVPVRFNCPAELALLRLTP
jgi:hypothetical protein